MDQSGDFLRAASVGATGGWALLIDGENVASGHAATILGKTPEVHAVRRVYGDVAKLNGWAKVPELRVIHTPEGRNSADILLTIDAMTMATTGIRDFVIVTADGGLVHLIRRLREAGCRVVVMADERASAALRVAGHGFSLLPVQRETSPNPTSQTADPQSPSKDAAAIVPMPVTEFDQYVRQEVRRAGHGGLAIAALNKSITEKFQTGIGARPEKTWRAYFATAERATMFLYAANGPNALVVLAQFRS